MNARMTVMVLLIVACVRAEAQGLKEWLRQKQTQREYLAQQIAALKVYSGYLKKGYDIVRDGTDLIGDITGWEFKLHRDYFGSLGNVNPELLKSGKVQSMLAMHQDMESQRRNARSKMDRSEYFSTGEKQAIRRFLDNLENGCDKELEELMMAVTDGKLELTDDERIERIDKIYQATQRLLIVHGNTVPSILQLTESRERGEVDITIYRWLFGVD